MHPADHNPGAHHRQGGQDLEKAESRVVKSEKFNTEHQCRAHVAAEEVIVCRMIIDEEARDLIAEEFTRWKKIARRARDRSQDLSQKAKSLEEKHGKERPDRRPLRGAHVEQKHNCTIERKRAKRLTRFCDCRVLNHPPIARSRPYVGISLRTAHLRALSLRSHQLSGAVERVRKSSNTSSK